MNQEKIFYTVTAFFVTFFILFLLFLHPNSDSIHPHATDIKMHIENYPRGKWFILLYSKWIYALFFIFAEIWGSMMVSLLFWQFANKITSTNEAKRFYSMFGLIANISGIAAGRLLLNVSSKAKFSDNIHFFEKNAVPSLMMMVIACAIAVVAIYRWMHVYVLTNPIYYTPKESKSAKVKMSLAESFKLILTSKYLGLIVLLILSYGISMNLIEGPWKAKIKELYPTQHDYLAFMGRLNTWTGSISLIFFIVGTNILRKFNWFTAAIMTPSMILITGFLFFLFCLYSDKMGEFTLQTFGCVPLALAVNFGMIQNILSKSTKYSLFDSTKEMAYIPIDEELKTKGKAAVDVVGGRLGKAGGGFILSILLTLNPIGGFEGNMTYIMITFLIIMCVWIYAVGALNKEYTKSLSENR